MSATTHFQLVGPHEGKTMHVNQHEFVDGEFVFHGSPEETATLARVFSFYAAYPADEAELMRLRALHRPTAAPVEAPVVSVVQAELNAKLAEIQSGSDTDAALLAALGGDSTASPIVPSDSENGLPTLAEAIGALDPEADGHWTSNNLPAVDYLVTQVGRKVTRGDVEAVAEGYTRAKARAARAQ